MRMKLTRRGSVEILGFVIESVPQIYTEKNRFGKIVVDPLEEIGDNKIFALLHRSELKDVIDLYFLCESGFDLIENLERAQEKEGGLDPAMIAFLLSQVDLEQIPQYLLKILSIQNLGDFMREIKSELEKLSYPDAPGNSGT